MKTIAIAIHGGAGDDSDFIRKNIQQYQEALTDFTQHAYEMLHKGGSAVDAVELAVKSLEDNPLFNAGKGSAINSRAEVTMDASIMDGKTGKAGAVAGVKNVRNPICLARAVMDKSDHVMLGGPGASEFAAQHRMRFEPDHYFITERQLELYNKAKSNVVKPTFQKRHGTVGAVALDEKGNLAAATSTGGMENAYPGRISDSCIIGAGCYASNSTCAVSVTGDGEAIITGTIAHGVSAQLTYTNCSISDACDQVLLDKLRRTKADIGLISLDCLGNFGIKFNSERMHRACMSSAAPLHVAIY